MINFDLDRLAVPLRGRGGGQTTSGLVQLLSHMEFLDEDVVIICHEQQVMEFHLEQAMRIAKLMGFKAVRVAAQTIEIDREKRIYWERPGHTIRQRKKHAYYLSSITKELVSEETFYRMDGHQ